MLHHIHHLMWNMPEISSPQIKLGVGYLSKIAGMSKLTLNGLHKFTAILGTWLENQFHALNCYQHFTSS